VAVPGGPTDDIAVPAAGQVAPHQLRGTVTAASVAKNWATSSCFRAVLLPPEEGVPRASAGHRAPFGERLGKPTALGVLAPDCISSTAYGTEEILFELVKAVGVAAFQPPAAITFAVIVVLLFVTLILTERSSCLHTSRRFRTSWPGTTSA